MAIVHLVRDMIEYLLNWMYTLYEHVEILLMILHYSTSRFQLFMLRYCYKSHEQSSDSPELKENIPDTLILTSLWFSSAFDTRILPS